VRLFKPLPSTTHIARRTGYLGREKVVEKAKNRYEYHSVRDSHLTKHSQLYIFE
jgi:hypothetical protein